MRFVNVDFLLFQLCLSLNKIIIILKTINKNINNSDNNFQTLTNATSTNLVNISMELATTQLAVSSVVVVLVGTTGMD